MIRTTLPRLAPVMAWLASTALALPAIAQPEGEPPVLEGPKVEAEATKPTLVHRGYDGALEPLEAPPEVAALDLLDLDADTREAIDHVLGARAATIDGVVLRNVRTLVELQTAKATGDKAAQRELLGSLVDQLEPLRKSGRLVDQIAKVLPDEQVPEYRRLVRERHMARFEEIRAELRSEGLEDVDAAAFKRLIGEALGLEIKRSYDRIVESGTSRLEETLEALELDTQTEGEVRRLVQDFAQKTALNPSPEQRRELFGQIYRALPADARERLVRMVREPRGD
ncbi:MAG: hypothetical protein R3B57_03050 [Phycisphaerales bacterium]